MCCIEALWTQQLLVMQESFVTDALCLIVYCLVVYQMFFMNADCWTEEQLMQSHKLRGLLAWKTHQSSILFEITTHG